MATVTMQDAATTMTAVVTTMMMMTSVTMAVWPAFPSNMGGGESNPRRREVTHNDRLAAGSDMFVSDSCSCVRELHAVDARCRESEKSLQEMRAEMETLQRALKVLQGRSSAVRQGQDVAFSARVGYNRPYLGETEVIVFDELLINNGDVYDPYTGKFTSPVAGVYQFQATVLSGFNATIETMLVLNGNEVGRLFSGGFNTRGSGTNGVLLNMDPGDQVWVSVFFGNGDYVHGLWSTFSGFLVRAFKSP